MISKKLQRARDFEKKYIPYVAEELPKFHVTGGIGWINDPNGFAPYHGEYHLFYQYHPYDVNRYTYRLGTCQDQRLYPLGASAGGIGSGCGL